MNEYYHSLPKKRMGAGVLLFNQAGQLLLLRPTYHDGWIIPGGVVEEDESPREAAIRETEEELGIRIGTAAFRTVDYGHGTDGKSESLQFLFEGGTLFEQEIAAITLSPEHSEYAFVTPQEAVSLVSDRLRRRLELALSKDAPPYTESLNTT